MRQTTAVPSIKDMVELSAGYPQWLKLSEKDYLPDKPASQKLNVQWKAMSDRKTHID